VAIFIANFIKGVFMEFLELSILILIAYLIWKKPEKEALAFKLFVGVFVLIAVVFFAIDIQFFMLPPMNL
jgi:hypothetical protein